MEVVGSGLILTKVDFLRRQKCLSIMLRIVATSIPQPISTKTIFWSICFSMKSTQCISCCSVRSGSHQQSLNMRTLGRSMAPQPVHLGRFLQLIQSGSISGRNLFYSIFWQVKHCRWCRLPWTYRILDSGQPACWKWPSTLEVKAKQLWSFCEGRAIMSASSFKIWQPRCGFFSLYITRREPQNPQKRSGCQTRKLGLAQCMKLNFLAKGGQCDQKPYLPRKSGSPESLPMPAPVPMISTLAYLINLAARCMAVSIITIFNHTIQAAHTRPSWHKLPF